MVGLLALGIIIIQSYTIHSLRSSLDVSTANHKALLVQIDSLESRSIEFKYAINDLQYYNDSITKKLTDTYESLRIKEKTINRLEYIASTAYIRDSIIVKDTIFVDDLHLDTTITNDWYKVGIALDYPNKVTVEPLVKSEKHIISYASKETINKPKKFFLCRWFQKKHTLVRVEVVEKNPYITNTQTKFIEIVK